MFNYKVSDGSEHHLVFASICKAFIGNAFLIEMFTLAVE